MCSDDWEEVVIVSEFWEYGFDDRASYGNGVIFLDVQLAVN